MTTDPRGETAGEWIRTVWWCPCSTRITAEVRADVVRGSVLECPRCGGTKTVCIDSDDPEMVTGAPGPSPTERRLEEMRIAAQVRRLEAELGGVDV